ncbi:MAG: ribosome recycling factor [Bacteroidota bacterium]
MFKNILNDSEDRMQKAVEILRDELAHLRTGRATTALLDAVRVDYYGAPTPLHQVANIGTPDVHLITVQPWDKTMMVPIERAILGAGLGLNPINDGNVIRVPIPPLNEERRRELVKLAKKFAEDGRIAVRNVRRDCIEHLRKAEKEEHFSEDERKRGEQEAQKLTDKYIKEIDQLVDMKDKEIMEV